MKNIIHASIILYNMIVEDKHDIYQNNIDYDSVGNNTSTFEVSLGALTLVSNQHTFKREHNLMINKNTINFKQI